MTDIDQRTAAERAAADKAAADRTKAEEERQKAIEKRVADQGKEREKQAKEAYEHDDPTPTQEELDAAKLAAMPGEPDPEAPPPAGFTRTKTITPEHSQERAGYSTKASEPKPSQLPPQPPKTT
jgi:hypothetical protein